MLQAFHPNASEAFDTRAIEILAKVKKVDNPKPKSGGKFKPDRHIAHMIDESMLVGEPKQGETVDAYTGEVVELLIRTSKQDALQLDNPACIELRRLSSDIAASKSLRSLVAESTVRSELIDWIRESATFGVKRGFVDRLLSEINSCVREYDVWLPVNSLYIESELQLGPIRFRTIERELLEAWIESWLAGSDPQQREESDRLLRQRLLPLRGLAAATIRVAAEPTRAREIALHEAHRAVAFLRVFSTENLHPLAVSTCQLLGQEYQPGYNVWFFEGEKAPSLAQEGSVGSAPFPWELSDEKIEELKKFGFEELQSLLAATSLSAYEENLLESMLIYSKSSIARDPAEKLLFIFAALETMLLRDKSENLQQNVGERFAFLGETDSGRRREVLKLYKGCYNLRSRFVHHGQSIDDIELVARFMVKVQILFERLLRLRKDLKSKQELVEMLEAQKFA